MPAPSCEYISLHAGPTMADFEEKELLVPDSMQEDNVEGPLPGTEHEGSKSQSSVQSQGTRCWLYATIILCLYGFFKEFKPSEPFLTPFLVDYKNFTKDEVNSKVYPYWPYSYLVAALFTFLLTDFLRYIPVILLESLAYLSTRILLVWGTSISSMQWMQVAYGVATATEVAYFSYIYTAVALGRFKQVTSCVRAVRLFGQSMAGFVGQILISTRAFNTLQLNYISFASVSVACVFAVLLSLTSVLDGTCVKATGTCVRVVTSSQQRDSNKRSSVLHIPLHILQSIGKWFLTELRHRWSDFVKFYSQPSLLKWSIWWALAMCGVLQVGNYVQSLWKEVASSSGVGHEYNGVVEALATLCGAAAAAIVSVLKVNWSVWGELTIGSLSLLDSLVLFFASSATALWGVYLSHIVYRSTFAFLITIASTQLALKVEHNSYALIFGFNTFLALVLQTILTLVVADEHVLDLPIRTQFVVYSGYYYVLTLIFVGAGVYKLTTEGWIASVRVCCREPPTTSTPSESSVSTPSEPTTGHLQIQADSHDSTYDPDKIV